MRLYFQRNRDSATLYPIKLGENRVRATKKLVVTNCKIYGIIILGKVMEVIMQNNTRERIYEYIVQFQSETGGRSPSLQEIAEAVGLFSGANVSYHIARDDRLVRRGYRWIEVVPANAQEEEQCH